MLSVHYDAAASPTGVAQPAESDVQPEALTIEDLKAAIAKGPRLDSGDIANTSLSDEEFLGALATRRGGTSPSRRGHPV